MKIPDICPIQIWPVGKPTFNQLIIKGIMKQYYYQVYSAVGILRIPINFEVAGSYLLELFDTSGTLIDIFPFVIVSEGNYRAEIDFSLYPDLTDTRVLIKVSLGHAITNFVTEADPTLPLWTISSGDFSLTDSFTPETATLKAGTISGILISPELDTPISLGESITFKIKFHVEGDGANGYLTIYLQDLFGVNISDPSSHTLLANGDYEYLITLTTTSNLGTLGAQLYVAFGKLSGTAGVAITEIEFSPFIYWYSTDGYLGQSDCFTLLSDITNCINIGFTNTHDFDNVDFETDQPVYYFLLDGAHFWEEPMSSSEEDHELSSGVIVLLKNETYIKRLLRLYDPAPDYIHRKLRKILQLDTIHSDGFFWRLNGAEYQKGEIATSTINPATVVLTQYDSGLVNIGGSLGGSDFDPDDFSDDFA